MYKYICMYECMYCELNSCADFIYSSFLVSPHSSTLIPFDIHIHSKPTSLLVDDAGFVAGYCYCGKQASFSISEYQPLKRHNCDNRQSTIVFCVCMCVCVCRLCAIRSNQPTPPLPLPPSKQVA